MFVEVALVCWNGHAGRGLQAGWDRIVNLDIKPDKIFIDVNDTTEPMLWARQYPHVSDSILTHSIPESFLFFHTR